MNLHDISWHLASGNSKKYLPSPHIPPTVKVPRIRAKLGTPKYCSSRPHRCKSYADDLSLISSDPKEHASSLQEINDSCKQLDLHLKPSKCISLVYNGKQIDRSKVFAIGDSGNTTNVAHKPTKFLGKILGHNLPTTRKAATDKLNNLLLSQVLSLNSSPIRGEYKVYILHHFILRNAQFYLAVDNFSQSQLGRIQRTLTRFIRKWLHLPPCLSKVILFHKDGLGLKSLPSYEEEVKIGFFTRVMSSADPSVSECILGLEQDTLKVLHHMSVQDIEIIKNTAASIQNSRQISSRVNESSIIRRSKAGIVQQQCVELEKSLEQLQIQNSLLDVLPLEHEDSLWKRIITGLPNGQLSFVLRACSETLPSPSTLVRWNYKFSRKCPLCDAPLCNVKHILNCCPKALEDGRYTWRHDKILLLLIHFLKEFNPSSSVFADIPEFRAHDSPQATVPSSIISTTARPDIFMKSNNNIILLELTVPWNSATNMTKARDFKLCKPNYQLLISDLQALGYSAQLHTMEIGSLGHCSHHAFSALKAAAPLSKVRDRRHLLTNIAKTAINCSHTIFNARSCPSWSLSYL